MRGAALFDRTAVSVSGGLLAAIPVVAVFGGSVAGSDPIAAATMGAGAMLVGIAWRVGGGRPPRALMATDAAVMALSTFVGAATGSLPALHLAMLFVWALASGLVVAVGRRGAVVGTQALIAFVVFGRFSQPVAPALGLAALVLAGGLAEVLFVSVIRWPLPLRIQRHAVGHAYRALGALAVAPVAASAIPAASSLDEAELTVSSPTLFGDPTIVRLRSLIDEGRRVRLELSGIRAMLKQLGDPTADGAHDVAGSSARPLLEQVSRGLDQVGAAVEGDAQAGAAFAHTVSQLSSSAEALSHAAAARPPDGSSASVTMPIPVGVMRVHIAQRFSALAGQLRAIGGLVAAAGRSGRLAERRPRRGLDRPGAHLRADLAQMRANLSRDSPAGRHAVRLAVVVVATELLARHLPLQRSYWMVVAAATALRPEFGATFTRGAERILGTVVGVAIAGAIAVAFHPGPHAIVAIIALLAWAAYALFPASFAVGFAFITALIVFLLEVVTPGTFSTASDRLVDALVGGAIGLSAYALWPTWSSTPARLALANLIAAQRRYLHVVLGSIVDGRQAPESELRPAARAARLARTQADSAIAHSLADPATRRIDADQSQAMLAALRRLVEAIQILRIDAQGEHERIRLDTLAPLAEAIDAALAHTGLALRAEKPQAPDAPTPQLREMYARFAEGQDAVGGGAILLAELDEIVDAVNTLGALAGDPPADLDPPPPGVGAA